MQEGDLKRRSTITILTVLVIFLVGSNGRASRGQLQQAPQATTPQSAKEPSNQEINDAFVQQISKQIAGHEQEQSGQVFKNIQVDFP